MADVTMSDVAAAGVDTDTTADEILLAATNHDLESLKKLLKTGNANVQDAETGFTPLHAAIASCAPDEDLDEDMEANGESDAVHSNALEEEAALETLKLLFENGAIWNELDLNDDTPGCLAHRLGLTKLYEAVVAAGVRAELLFNRMDDFELLVDESDEEEGEETKAEEAVEIHQHEPTAEQADSSVPAIGVTTTEGEDAAPDESTGPVKLKNPNVVSADYLTSELTYTNDGKLLDEDKNAIMMDWETEIMGRSVEALCQRPGLRTMNVGHGMGIVDGKFLDKNPAMHHIVEAHPAVIQRLKETGWYSKPNVTVHEGKWQDVFPKLIAEGLTLDAIYYDTYAETYKDLKEFFAEYVIALLDQNGRFGFYHGLGADRQVCYDVYTQIVEMDLMDAGMDTEWQVLGVPDLDGEGQWKGIRRKYWDVDMYRLPTCQFLSAKQAS
ncbi:arginine N-methyltransferase 2 [Polychaeton citri CBS 116435]|uniref:Arginine N-methyltransferase 2 n=1 Tax=Polychaeton citri CBS 116435 TaxID=1314669 RepID=A0A9P4QAG0_9PEZI|nr:arginine N-methyltransferase 2 [Polychaeton citri CBS 116435]